MLQPCLLLNLGLHFFPQRLIRGRLSVPLIPCYHPLPTAQRARQMSDNSNFVRRSLIVRFEPLAFLSQVRLEPYTLRCVHKAWALRVPGSRLRAYLMSYAFLPFKAWALSVLLRVEP